MKAGILEFARACGIVHTPTSGYHETLTRFWTLVIVAHVQACGATSRWDAVRAALDRFGEDRDLRGGATASTSSGMCGRAPSGCRPI